MTRTNAHKILSKPIRKVNWIVENYIPEKSITMLASRPGVGKTNLALHLWFYYLNYEI